MDDRFNTFAGWALFGGIVALGLASLSSRYFQADKNHRPHKMGYEIEGVVASEGGSKVESIAARLAKADPTKGQATFAKCASCHTINQGGANGIGPNLYGLVGEAIAQGRGGFAFSDALKSKGGNWTFDNLDQWLTSPKAYANGTKMTFAGIGDGQDRANLIAWLNTQGSNVPLPAAPAEGAADADKADPAKADAGKDAAAKPAEAADAAAKPAEGTAAGGKK
ncbi:MAG: cytochrome c family protein [Novosphingobium sp.]|jgi:cytochrome c|nr:cytochrome c family protein [Novosphingobium sp.]